MRGKLIEGANLWYLFVLIQRGSNKGFLGLRCAISWCKTCQLLKAGKPGIKNDRWFQISSKEDYNFAKLHERRTWFTDKIVSGFLSLLSTFFIK
mmetsp:Transcript_9563/g.20073  ORF Transcript_9563/g.20073 Transcript_9563/m.20073 type:complete len:94 (+) Transcript_9563:404-685(+)